MCIRDRCEAGGTTHQAASSKQRVATSLENFPPWISGRNSPFAVQTVSACASHQYRACGGRRGGRWGRGPGMTGSRSASRCSGCAAGGGMMSSRGCISSFSHGRPAPRVRRLLSAALLEHARPGQLWRWRSSGPACHALWLASAPAIAHHTPIARSCRGGTRLLSAPERIGRRMRGTMRLECDGQEGGGDRGGGVG
eukprot:1365751-Rhodomonas_salina.2